jgi:class 3 adenylate cyclase/predicted ATPase
MPVERALERRVVTVLFADVAGFTALGDSLDPEDLRAVQDAYFAAARETIDRYGGVVEKFIGDAVVALFGVPRTRDDDAERAVRAALALVGAVEQLGARIGLEPEALRVRVGVNTGEVLHGEESPDRGAATGDAVNVASRLQSAADPGSVLVGGETALAVEAAIELDAPVELELKGKAEPVRARRAAGVRPESSREQAMGNLRAPLLGRTGELGTLAAATARVVVVAPPGAGKTRLVDEFARTLETTQVCRARLRAEMRSPQPAVAQLVLSALPASVRGRSDAATALIRDRLVESGRSPARADVVVEELAAVAWPETGGSVERDRDREALFGAWIEGLDALAAERPALWLVEDVHWAGGDLLAFLDRAGCGSRRVLTTARPSLLEREPEWCEGAEILMLPPLPATGIIELVRALVGDVLPDVLVDRVAERADGNPLFVEELLRSWISSGVLVADGGAWRLAVEQEVVPLPTTVQAIYAAQIDDLPGSARAVTRNASVAGRRFPAAGLQALGVAHHEAGVDVLVRRALVSGPLPDPLGDSFAFRHALLRDAAYAGLARRERAQLHVSFARWIETAAGAHLAELAESVAGHYAAALEHAPALAAEVVEGLGREDAAMVAAGWYERAAEVAVGGAAHEAACEHLRRSIELSPETFVLDRSRRWRLLAEASTHLDEAEQAARTALELARSAFPDDRSAAREAYADAAAALGRVLHEQLRFHEEIRLAEDVLAEIGGADRATAVLLLLWAFAAEGIDAPVERRLESLDRARDLAARCGDTHLEFRIRARRTLEATDLDESSILECADLARLGAKLGEWSESVRALHSQAALLIDHGSIDDALAVLAGAFELAQAHGLTELLAWNGYWQVEASLVSGAWTEASTAGFDAIAVAEPHAYHRAAVRTWFALVPIAGARRDREVLAHARAWFDAQELSAVNAATMSPFAHLMTSGVEIVLARAGLGEPPEPVAELCLAEMSRSEGLPSWHAAVDEILRLWIERHEHDRVRDALERRAVDRTSDSRPTLLGRGIDGVAAALLDCDPARAGAALDCFRELRTPWWTSKALRVLESFGAETAGAEAASIERGLGIRRAS